MSGVLDTVGHAHNFFAKAASLHIENGPAGLALVMHIGRVLVVGRHEERILIARCSRSPKRNCAFHPVFYVGRRRASNVSADLRVSILSAGQKHDHAMNCVIGPHCDGIARGRGHFDHSHRFIRRALRRIAHVIDLANLLIAIGIDVRFPSSKADTRRLKLRVGLARSLQNALPHHGVVGCQVISSASSRTVGRAVVMGGGHAYMARRYPQLLRNSFGNFVPVGYATGINAH